MAVDKPKEHVAKKNLSMLLDLQNMLTLPCFMPMLHFVNSLTKFAQSPTCYIVHSLSTTKICEGDLYRLYVDPTLVFLQRGVQHILIVEQDQLFCHNREDDHLVLKVVGVSHMTATRSSASLGNMLPYQMAIADWKAQKVHYGREDQMPSNVCCCTQFLNVVVVDVCTSEGQLVTTKQRFGK